MSRAESLMTKGFEDISPMGLTSNNNLPSITVLICTLNEEQNIAFVLKDIPSFVSEILISDGNSTDKTVEIATAVSPRSRVIYQQGKGKGDAIRYGIQEAKGEIIVTLDADGSMDPMEVERFIQPLLDGYDYAKGSRFLPGAGTDDMPRHRRFGNRVFTMLTNLLHRTKYTDISYGYNAYWKRAVQDIRVRSDGFDEVVEWNIKIHKAELRVIEVPSFERTRLHGQGKLRSFEDGAKILRTILLERLPWRR